MGFRRRSAVSGGSIYRTGRLSLWPRMRPCRVVCTHFPYVLRLRTLAARGSTGFEKRWVLDGTRSGLGYVTWGRSGATRSVPTFTPGMRPGTRALIRDPLLPHGCVGDARLSYPPCLHGPQALSLALVISAVPSEPCRHVS